MVVGQCCGLCCRGSYLGIPQKEGKEIGK
jgi:hypothetical protein